MHWTAPSEKDTATEAPEKRRLDDVLVLQRESKALRRTHDLLLPRLLTCDVHPVAWA